MSIKLDRILPREDIIRAYNLCMDHGWIDRKWHYDIVDIKGKRYVKMWRVNRAPQFIRAEEIVEAVNYNEDKVIKSIIITGK